MRLILPMLLLGALASPAAAQAMDPNMPGMDHGGEVAAPAADSAQQEIQVNDRRIAFANGSGTSRLPASAGAMHGLHIMPGGEWMLMLHAAVSTQYTSISGPRGEDKLYATSMAMVMAQKPTDWGKITFHAMASLEPLMRPEGYPNLFATGETAHGQPIVDRQHPHDLFMELSARADVDVAARTTLFLYGGPVAEPALGPSAFMHRGSAAHNPEPPITHHWFDSTHISYGVVTAGVSVARWQIEASAFRGQEPDERRWNIETPRLDSWSLRASWNPSPRWSAQVSHGFLKQPESTHKGENEHRTTASLHYADHQLSAMLGFSAKARKGGPVLTAWLAEADWQADRHNTLFGRIENVANDELFPDPASPLHEQAFRVTKFQMGYARRIPLGAVELALGGAVSAYAKPSALNAVYGNNPLGYTVFAKFSLGQ